MKRSPSAVQKRAPAFTLLELLFVVTIIACLCLLVMPLSGPISARSNLIKCTGNLRQFAAVLSSFAADNNGDWPYPADDRENANPPGTWFSRPVKVDGQWQGLGKLFPYVNDRRLFICPADKVKMATLRARGAFHDAEGTFANDYVTRGFNQSRNPTRPNMKRLSTMGRRAIVSCNFGYASSNPTNYPLSWHSGTYPVLYSDGSTLHQRFPAEAIRGTPPNINDNTGMQIKIWDFFDDPSVTFNLN